MDSEKDHRAIEAAEHAAAMMANAGMPRMPARVMMALVAAPEGGYTAAELGERLGVSAAAVSGAVRYLQQVRFIQRVSRPGDRRDRYELVHDTFYGSVVSAAPVYERMADHIDEIADAHLGDERAQQRAGELADFFRFMGERMPALVDEWRTVRDAAHTDRSEPAR